MKRFLSFILASVMLLSFAACGNSAGNLDIKYDDTYIEGQDFQYNFCDKSTGKTVLQKGNGGYYFSLNNFLYFADESTMKPVVLCDKTDCLHDKETDGKKAIKCNAYLSRNLLNSMFYVYGDYIYKVEDESYYEGDKLIVVNTVYKSKSDGSGTKKVFTIHKNINGWFIHRGVIYYTTDVDSKVTAFDLTDNEESTFVDLDSIGLYNTVVEKITAYGNNVYFVVNGYESEESFNKMVDSGEANTIEEIYAVNITDKSNFTITADSGFGGLIFEGFNNDFLIVSDADYDAENPEKKMYSVDKSGNKKQLDYEYKCLYDYCYFDGGFTYVKKGTSVDDVQKNIFEVYENDKLLTTVDFPDGYVNGLYLGDENYLFYYEDSEDAQRLYYISKADLAAGKAELNVLF